MVRGESARTRPRGGTVTGTAPRPDGSVAGDIVVAVEECPVSDSVAVVWDDALLGYTMGGDHPLHPVRLDLTMRLADTLGVLATDRPHVPRPTPADVDLLTLVHDPAYLDAVRRAPADPGVGHGLGTADNPIFEGMFDAAALITGGSVLAARRVPAGTAQHAVNISGGLHHAMRDAASGFCVFNDAAIAIAWLLGKGYERIAYVDLDVHHGDGVQAAFYEDPRVLTVSVHQTPLTLFPGTGYPEETGDAGKAMGRSEERRVGKECRSRWSPYH